MILLQEQKNMGGIDRYQKASMYGAKSSKFVCADWVAPFLYEHHQVKKTTTTTTTINKVDQIKNNNNRPKILDVGAIDNQYQHIEWMDCTPIDLNAQHPSVRQIDFFDFAYEHITNNSKGDAGDEGDEGDEDVVEDVVEDVKDTTFDAIVMSLVLNFQGDPRKRGK